ncbi:HPr kinase/phosphatase C-terminal domain-containing protein [Reyranella aquatilis]|uniref:HPr kinase/phosphatase C-terminal domain-containing protein n=1 Tax=Reyranella aquatilis TaxID=2035356 RepID=A0ABS8KVL5_9HYPH|nr:HPr kinase/phosphatase C-terminal domain-containing protein [Reyranella aquatilis]MCC8429631.1 HPr kinase/phosphatase C-terminal domain-containing protein [Reyranella aquatilis]
MTVTVKTYVHATCVALQASGRQWRGVLLRGPSGAGKSDLALRLIDAGAKLVADDQTALFRRGRSLIAAPPGTISGLMEVRGLGIVQVGRSRQRARVPVALLVDLVTPEKIERMPEPAREDVLGVDLPVIALAPFEASASAKLRLALARIPAA